MQPIILYLDMNSYFATVEQQDKPCWRGQVLGVCEHLGGIIIAASIEAKKWGIKTGTPVWEARKIYPKIILTPTRPEAYRNYNRKLVKLVSDYTDKVEVASIDEVVLDLTKASNVRFKIQDLRFKTEQWKLANPFEEAVKIAREIKQRMKTQVGDYLTCSIGIAENKLLAKIASDLQKPDGLVVVSEKFKVESEKEGCLVFSREDLYKKLKLTDIPGIGRRMERRLNVLGIRTLLDLKNFSRERLAAAFGIGGYHLYQMGQLNASWKPEVSGGESIKSLGHMYTLPKNYRQRKFFEPVLYKLCEMVARRLRRKNFCGQELFVHAESTGGQYFSKAARLGEPFRDGREIFLHSRKIFAALGADRAVLRFIGVTVGGLKKADRQQSLFQEDARQERVLEALDKINSKYGEFTVARTEAVLAGKVFHDSVGFGRVKEL